MQDSPSMEKKANLLDVDRNHNHQPVAMSIQARQLRQPQEVDERRTFREWIDYIQKHKPQSNALALGAFVILNGGVQFASGIFNHHLVKEREDEIELSAEISSWFAAAIVGFILSAGIVTRHSKVAIYVSELDELLVKCLKLKTIHSSLFFFFRSRLDCRLGNVSNQLGCSADKSNKLHLRDRVAMYWRSRLRHHTSHPADTCCGGVSQQSSWNSRVDCAICLCGGTTYWCSVCNGAACRSRSLQS